MTHQTKFTQSKISQYFVQENEDLTQYLSTVNCTSSTKALSCPFCLNSQASHNDMAYGSIAQRDRIKWIIKKISADHTVSINCTLDFATSTFNPIF